jgi:hypothetical protein
VNCKTCFSGGTDANTNCNTCADGYWLLSDNPTQCQKVSPIDYFFDVNKFSPCDPSCNTCQITATTCVSCNYENKYYPLIDDKSKCYRDYFQVSYYYFDDITKAFQKCYSSCQTCSGYKDISDQMCTKCKDNYYPLIDKTSNCFSANQAVDGYYYDDANKIFNKCYDSCLTCAGPGSLADPNCLICKDGQSCVKCTTIIYNNQCNLSCPKNTIYVEKENTCYECQAKNLSSYNGVCLEVCPPSYSAENYVCYKCSDNNKVEYGGQCVDSCPNGWSNTDGVCLKSIVLSTISSLNSNAVTCTDTSCQNAGICSIKYNAISCQCPQNYTGLVCQVNNQTITLDSYIGINYIILENQLNNVKLPMIEGDMESILDVLKVLQDNPNLINTDTLYKILGLASKVKF